MAAGARFRPGGPGNSRPVAWLFRYPSVIIHFHVVSGRAMNGSGDCDEVVRAVGARLPSGGAVWVETVTDEAPADRMTSVGGRLGLAVGAGKGGGGG